MFLSSARMGCYRYCARQIDFADRNVWLALPGTCNISLALCHPRFGMARLTAPAKLLAQGPQTGVVARADAFDGLLDRRRSPLGLRSRSIRQRLRHIVLRLRLPVPVHR